MGGTVAMVLRSKGKIRVRHDYKAEATYALWRPGFFKRPCLAGRAHKVPFAPYDYGMVFIDADRKWIGSIQNYGELTRHNISWVFNSDMGTSILPQTPATHPVALRTPYRHGQMRGEQATLLNANGTSLESLKIALEDAQRRASIEREERGWVKLDAPENLEVQLPAAWRLEEFDRCSAEDWNSFIHRLMEHGVYPSREDAEFWRDYLAWCELPPSLTAPFEASHEQTFLEQTLPLAAPSSQRNRLRM